MSHADELLDATAEAGAQARTATPDTEPHIVINADRTITVPDELKRIAVQYDNNIETVTFDCPRYWDEHDLSEMDITINYMTPDMNLGTHEVDEDDVTVDDDDDEIIHFVWTINEYMTQLSGGLVFNVCATGEDLHWSSEINDDLYISEGLSCDGALFEEFQRKIVTPTKAQQLVTADARYRGLSEVSVLPIPDIYADISQVTAEAGDVLAGKKFVSDEGELTTGTLVVSEGSDPSPVTTVAGDVLAGKKFMTSDGEIADGTMANNGALSGQINGLTATSYTIPAGYTSGGTVTLTDDIEDELAEI